MLTIEQLKALPVDEWVFIIVKSTDTYSLYSKGTYARKRISGDDIFRFETIEALPAKFYFDYGITWIAYKNKEQAENDL